MWESNLTRPQQSGWSTGSDWEKSDIWLLETCGCNTMLVQGKFEFPKCQDGRIRAVHRPSILGWNRGCATRKLAVVSLSLMMTSRDKCRWVVLCRGVDFVGHQEVFQNSAWTKVVMRIVMEGTEKKIRPEDRDARTKVVMRIVMEGTK